MARREPIIVKQLDAMQLKPEAEGNLTLNSKMLPEIAKWQVGEKYKVKIVEMVQKSSREIEDNVIEADFEVLAVENG